MTYGLVHDNHIAQMQNNCSLFSVLSKRHLLELEAEGAIRTYSFDDGEEIRFNGRSGKEAVFVLSGAVEYCVDGRDKQRTGDNGASCTPVNLEINQSITFTALDAAVLCRADRDQLDFMTSWEIMVDNLAPAQMTLHDRLSSLHHPAVFMRLPFENVEEAFNRMDAIDALAGQDIIVQGEAGELFYIIEKGQAEVWQQGLYDDEQNLVATLGKGDHFGDEALVTGGTRNATVKMVEDGKLLTLKKDDFQELIHTKMVQEVDASVAKALMENGHQPLDVRYEEEFEESHLPDTILIPLPELRNRIEELDKGGKYISYCLSGKRSAVASMILRQHGIESVCLKEGIREWPYEMVEM